MNKEFLKEAGLLEAQKRYKAILEYTFIGSDDLTNEDDDDEAPNNDMPDEQGNMDGAPDEGNMPNGQEGMGNEPAPQGGEMLQGNDDNQQGGVEGFNPDMSQGSNGDEDGSVDDVETEQEGDEVIDVDDLTDAQEDTEKKVNSLSIKFDKLLSIVDKFDAILDSNNAKIDDLRAEFEKRNPTPIEKLQKQTERSYPFSITPDEYWAEKEKSSNYKAWDTDDEPEEEEFVITKDDVDNISNWQDIYRSLDSDEEKQNLRSIFNY